MNRRFWRIGQRAAWCIGVLLLAFAVTAQESGRVLTPNVAALGRLDDNTILQIFTIAADAGQILSVETSNVIGIPLALTISDARGVVLRQAVDSAVTGTLTVADIGLPSDGTYYLTIFKAGGVSSVSAVDFTITASLSSQASTLAPEAQTPTEAAPPAEVPTGVTPPVTSTIPTGIDDPGQVVTVSGLRVDLVWASIDDLDLELRDPVGGALYWDFPTVASGGTHSGNINQACAVTTADAPTETASWSPGGIPTGSYEIIVYYQNSCTGGQPASFNILVSVDNVTLPPVQGTVLPGQTYVTSVVLRTDGTIVATGLAGVVTEQLPADATEIIAVAQPITVGSSVNGRISNAAPYQSFVFEAQANDIVNVTLDAFSGSLDTFLFLLDSGGRVLRSNDDREAGFTDSAIFNALLPEAGRYFIVASRYAKRIGGTEGDYTLTLAGQALELPAEFAALPRGSLEISLLWNTAADVQLLVRDAAGDAIYDDVPQVRSGGRLAAQGNVNCRVSTGTPFSYIYYPTDILPRPGTYEVEVWFQNSCNDTTPVSFNLFGTYNGQTFLSANARPLENERYLTSFTITADGNVILSDGGIIRGLQDIPYQAELENARLIQPNIPVSDAINQDNKFDIFLYDGRLGESITVTMNNTSGTLDPLLYILNPFGDLLAENDDIVPGTDRDSLIRDLVLPANGRYIIIATHFGGRYGGTTGTYSLLLTSNGG